MYSLLRTGKKPVEAGTGKPLVETWEKMSKSKHNGIDPSEMIAEYGVDTTRLLILADVAPFTHRNWDKSSNFLILIKFLQFNILKPIFSWCRASNINDRNIILLINYNDEPDCINL